MVTEIIRNIYEYSLRIMENSEDTKLKLECFIYCITYAGILQRKGYTDLHVPFDQNVKEVLLDITKASSSHTVALVNELLLKCKKYVESSPPGFPLPESLIHEIVMVWYTRLYVSFQILYLTTLEGSEAEDMKPVLEWLRTHARELDALVKKLPKPLEVSEKLCGISKEFHIDGSPLFDWWDQIPDVIRTEPWSSEKSNSSDYSSMGRPAKEYLRPRIKPGMQVMERASKTDWENAPAAVRDWDMKIVERER